MWLYILENQIWLQPEFLCTFKHHTYPTANNSWITLWYTYICIISFWMFILSEKWARQQNQLKSLIAWCFAEKHFSVWFIMLQLNMTKWFLVNDLNIALLMWSLWWNPLIYHSRRLYWLQREDQHVTFYQLLELQLIHINSTLISHLKSKETLSPT